MLKSLYIPGILAGISLAGLVAALVWDDAREVLAVIAAATPVAALAWACARRQD